MRYGCGGVRFDLSNKYEINLTGDNDRVKNWCDKVDQYGRGYYVNTPTDAIYAQIAIKCPIWYKL